VKGRTDEGAKHPVTRCAHLLAVRWAVYVVRAVRCFVTSFHDIIPRFNWSHHRHHGLVPIRRNPFCRNRIRQNPIRQILKKYIVWVNAVVLWKNRTA